MRTPHPVADWLEERDVPLKDSRRRVKLIERQRIAKAIREFVRKATVAKADEIAEAVLGLKGGD